MDRWVEFKISSAFSSQSQACILAYLKSCVSPDILVNIDHKKIKTEKEFLEKFRKYIDTRLHPLLIHQLEIMWIHQKNGSSMLDVLSQQVTNYFEAGMDKNTSEEWLILLLVSTINEASTLQEVFKRTDKLKSFSDILRIAQSVESGVRNSNRVLGREGKISRVGTGDGEQHCYRCQQTGHIRPECKVPESQIWCQHFKMRRHNKHAGCKT